MQPIPYPDCSFDSISAFDFIEHVPRILAINQESTKFPFVELMSEIWRVLKPNGMFYALTPAFPHGAAFHDPTHVNFIAIPPNNPMTQEIVQYSNDWHIAIAA